MIGYVLCNTLDKNVDKVLTESYIKLVVKVGV